MKQFQRNCATWNRYFLCYTKEGRQIKHLLTKFKCKSWQCAHCAPKKAFLIAKRCQKNFAIEESRFLTLTLRPMEDKEEALRYIKKCWNRLRLLIVREFGKTKYCWTMEIQKNTQMPHLHVIINKYLPKSWLNMAVVRAGFGPICDIRKISSGQVFGYITKYITKGLGSHEMEMLLRNIKGRRVGFSRGMTLESLKEEEWKSLGTYRLHKSPQRVIETAVRNLNRKGVPTMIEENSETTLKTVSEDPFAIRNLFGELPPDELKKRETRLKTQTMNLRIPDLDWDEEQELATNADLDEVSWEFITSALRQGFTRLSGHGEL